MKIKYVCPGTVFLPDDGSGFHAMNEDRECVKLLDGSIFEFDPDTDVEPFDIGEGIWIPHNATCKLFPDGRPFYDFINDGMRHVCAQNKEGIWRECKSRDFDFPEGIDPMIYALYKDIYNKLPETLTYETLR